MHGVRWCNCIGVHLGSIERHCQYKYLEIVERWKTSLVDFGRVSSNGNIIQWISIIPAYLRILDGMAFTWNETLLNIDFFLFQLVMVALSIIAIAMIIRYDQHFKAKDAEILNNLEENLQGLYLRNECSVFGKIRFLHEFLLIWLACFWLLLNLTICSFPSRSPFYHDHATAILSAS